MLKLKRFDEGVWFDFPLDSGVKFKIRAMTPKKLIDLREKSKRGKIAVSKSNGLTDIVDDFDDAALNAEIFAWMLEDWKGFEFEGTPSSDEIKGIIFEHMAFREFIMDKSYDLFKTESQRIETELKNSGRSQSGSQKGEKQESGAKSAGKPTTN